jgi:hypothetical protein
LFGISKKLAAVVSVAAILVAGFVGASPANAAAEDALESSFAYRNTYFHYQSAANTISVTAGTQALSIRRAWTLKADDLNANGGKVLAVYGKLTYPDGTVKDIATNSATEYNGNASIMINTSGAMVNSQDTPQVTIPASGSTGGSVSANFYVDPTVDATTIQSGNYQLDLKLTLDGVTLANGATWNDSWYLNDASYGVTFAGASVVAPAGATSASYSAQVCLDSTKLTVGDTLTAKLYANGSSTDTSMSPSWQWRGNSGMDWRSSSGNSGKSTTVVSGDVSYGLAVMVNGDAGVVTPGSTYSTSYQILNQNSVNVTGSCVPATPSAPTLTYTGTQFKATADFPAFADSMSSSCALYDAAAPTVLIQQIDTWTQMMMGPSTNISCTFTASTIAGHSYIAKVRSGYMRDFFTPWSASSTPTLKPAPGFSFTSPISGIDNQAGKLSSVSTSMTSDADASISAVSDGGAGVYTVATTNTVVGMNNTPSAIKVRHATATGADATFGGSGSMDFAIDNTTNYAQSPRFTWFAGSRDKWALTYSNFVNGANSTNTYVIKTGSMSSATATSTIAIPAATVSAACVTAFGAGYTSLQMMGGMSTPPAIGLSAISAPTDLPLFNLNCSKSLTIGGSPVTTFMQAIVTVPDANTVNLVKVFATPSDTINSTTTVATSVNPAAGASDVAVTLFEIDRLQTGQTTYNTVNRNIFTIKKDLTVSTSTATWDKVATEPTVRVIGLNDGTIWGTLTEGTSQRLFKLVGNTLTTKNITLDDNANLTGSTLSFANGLQAGSTTKLAVIRSNPTASAMSEIDTATGAATTGEVAKYTALLGYGVVNAVFVASKNLYWLVTDAANSSKYSLFRWRDFSYVAVTKSAQTITWTTSPTSVTVGSTVTVAATASSSLAVTYSSSDATKCTVTSAGVVTPVATSGTCTIAADQAGNDLFNAAPQKTLAITIAAVAPAKKAPKVPTVATKAKVGKTFTVALHATKGTAAKGANADGLATVVSVAPASKAVCSVTKVIKSKKITGYTVKGLKAGKCSVVVTITGSATFNALTKTVAVTVTK